MADTRELFWEAEALLASDPDGAADRLRAAADLGDPASKFQLAVVLSDRDTDAARELLKELDAQDFDGAAYLLARTWWGKDSEQTKYWYRRAIARKDSSSSRAAMQLGIILSSWSPEPDDEGIRCLDQAFADRIEESAYWLARALEKTQPDRALSLYLTAAEEGVARAYTRSGYMYFRAGKMDEARRQIQAGAEAGDTYAMVGMFRVLMWRHPAKALRWLYRHLRAGGYQEATRAIRAQRHPW